MRMHRRRRAMARALMLAGAMALGLTITGVTREAAAQSSECLLEFQGATDVAFADGEEVCGEASNKVCTFNLKLCTNQAADDCTPGDLKKKIRAKGRCGRVGKLRVIPDGTASACGSTVEVRVRTKKRGRREGNAGFPPSPR